jgi:ATP-dependent exoDNAse (exonuclease V) beta subunit
MFTSIRENISSYIKDINIEDLNISRDYNQVRSFNYKEYINLMDVENDIKEISIDNKLLEEESYSKKENKLITKEEKDNMEYGTKVHHILECLDFINPDFSNIDDYIKNKIISFLNSDLLNNISNGKVFKEYEFMYEKDNSLNHGIIDLMIEYSDYIDIIDYKLKNISDENYINQLKGYKEYIENRTHKKCNLYLYSIIEEKYDIIT